MTTSDDGRTDTEEEDHWLYFGLDDDEISEYTALREDIPEFLETSLWEWIRDAFTAPARAPQPARIDIDLVRKCERVLEVPIAWPTTSGLDFVAVLRRSYTKRPDRIRNVWRLVNYLLRDGHAHGGTLKTYLLDARSVYTVAAATNGRCRLVRRVPEGVEVALAATALLGKAGKRLAEAWEAVFGVDRDPSKAYTLAIKAVEDAAIPMVCPKMQTPVLGDVIGELKSNPKWQLPFKREAPNAPAREVLVSMLQVLYKGQHDRHGGDPVPPPDMTQEEAESAVMLAVTLVGWFATGKVAKQP